MTSIQTDEKQNAVKEMKIGDAEVLMNAHILGRSSVVIRLGCPKS